MLPTVDRSPRTRPPENDGAQTAAAAAAAQAAAEAARRPHDPVHRAEAGWRLADKPLAPGANEATREQARAGHNVRTALYRTDLEPTQRAVLHDALTRLGNGILDGRVDPHVNDKLRLHLRQLATDAPTGSDFRGALAQLHAAADALGRSDLAPGTRLTYDPGFDQRQVARAGLPVLDIPEIDADVYYRTADGVLHLDGAKASPAAMANEVSEARALGDDSQLGRQSAWEQAQARGAPRQLLHTVLDTGPGFNHLLDGKRVDALQRLVGDDVDTRRIVIGERIYSISDFRQVIADGMPLAKAHVDELKRQHVASGQPARSFDVSGAYETYLKAHAGTPEQAMRSFGGTYGEPRPRLAPVEAAPLPSLRQGGAWGAAGGGGIALLRLGADGRLTRAEAAEVAQHTALGGGVGVVTAAGERAVTPVIDRAVGQGVQRVATRAAGTVARTATVEATAAFGAGARTLVTRAAGATAVGAVVATGISAYENRAGLARGDSRAIGNVTADTAVAVGSIAAATAAGAAVGSVVPVAGTAVGAVVGLAVGVGVAYGAQISGARDAVASTVSGWVDGVKGWF